ncbi:MAG: MarR family transcriptional regulator [Firmicutes bacterium]|uniref:MarR family transcriptional regulator n=1 Tax=Sulfobacillus benefaciens TaxID=453960 RepID=A0A2T2WY22_9FIRM|nr:MarR family transcriptional regulator [Bacillota bacterium]MCL5015303.1 MarR family transcriptional regulator [Bacillota bacterium]PSR27135.1 MAG: MarR family transcriptional regulator [Sulfobacillus benefaciens]HBQ95830.1 MarR family transcriptional regulator [Sulfobacillus sp.]
MDDQLTAKKEAYKSVMNIISVIGEPMLVELWQSLEITLTQFRCLRLLYIRPMQAGDLAKKLSLSPTSLTRVLERLESRQLIDRSIDREDRRRIWVSLTPQGRNMLDTIRPWEDSPLARALDTLPKDTLNRITEASTQIVEAVKALTEGDANP